SDLDLRTLVGCQVALPSGFAYLEPDRLGVVDELDAIERQPVGLILHTRRLGQCGGKRVVIERGFADAALRLDNNEFLGAAAQIVAIPKAGVILKPVWSDLGLV